MNFNIMNPEQLDRCKRLFNALCFMTDQSKLDGHQRQFMREYIQWKNRKGSKNEL